MQLYADRIETQTKHPDAIIPPLAQNGCFEGAQLTPRHIPEIGAYPQTGSLTLPVRLSSSLLTPRKTTDF